MIKHVNYQIRNIPFLFNETENVVPDAPLTNYPGEDFWAESEQFDLEIRCKSTAIFWHSKIFQLIVKCCISALSKTKTARTKTNVKRKLQNLKQTRFSFY